MKLDFFTNLDWRVVSNVCDSQASREGSVGDVQGKRQNLV